MFSVKRKPDDHYISGGSIVFHQAKGDNLKFEVVRTMINKLVQDTTSQRSIS